jgi:hypothetical protein
MTSQTHVHRITRIAKGGALAALVLTAAACEPPPPPPPVTTIVYEVGMGAKYCTHCYASKITASSTGAVEVVRRTADQPHPGWTTEKENIVITPEQFARFKARLERARPTGEGKTEGSPDCGDQLLEQDIITVSWTEGQRADHLTHSFNCVSPRAIEITQALLAAPGDLGVKVEVKGPAAG